MDAICARSSWRNLTTPRLLLFLVFLAATYMDKLWSSPHWGSVLEDSDFAKLLCWPLPPTLHRSLNPVLV